MKKYIYLFGLFFTFSSAANIIITPKSEIQIPEGTSLINIMSVGSSNLCFLKYTPAPYDRKISIDREFLVKPNVKGAAHGYMNRSAYRNLTEQDLISYVKIDLLAAGYPPSVGFESLDEIDTELKKLGSSLDMNNLPKKSTTVSLFSDDRFKTPLDISCLSDERLTKNEIINLIINQSDFKPRTEF